MEKKTLILDASVIIKWYIQEKDSDIALNIRDSLIKKETDIVVPGLIYYEIANALRYAKGAARQDIEKAIGNIFLAALKTECVDERLLKDALALAIKYDTTIYDSVYLALAERHDTIYVTADAEFCKKVGGEHVVLLSEFASKR
ncbi:MAG: type II toxin-antitoxin system VapC family toxin [Thermoplasmata archaeon]